MPGSSTIAVVSKDVVGYVTSLSLDIVIIIALGAFFVAAFIHFGKKRSLAFIFAILFSLFSMLVAPLASIVEQITAVSGNQVQESLLNIGIFAVLSFLLFFFFKQTSGGLFAENKVRKWIEAFLMSFSTIIIFMLAIYNVVPFQSIYDLSQPLDSLFGESSMIVWWTAAVFAALYLATRPHRN